MIWLLLSVALAQEPQTFAPLPVDHEEAGEVYAGILVDEATFTELVELRVEVKTKDAEIVAFEEWQKSHLLITETALGEMRVSCEEGQQRLTDHYEEALKAEKRKDWFQRHAFPVGVAAGLVGATAIYIGATRFYGEVLSIDL